MYKKKMLMAPHMTVEYLSPLQEKSDSKRLTQTWVRPLDIFGDFPQASDQRLCCHNYSGENERERLLVSFCISKQTHTHTYAETDRWNHDQLLHDLAIWWVTGFSCHSGDTYQKLRSLPGNRPTSFSQRGTYSSRAEWDEFSVCEQQISR